MKLSKGVVYVAYGEAAQREATYSIETLRQYHPNLDVSLIDDSLFKEHGAALSPGRWAKVNMDRLSKYSNMLYLDADTRVNGNLDIGFDLLKRGWELIMIPSISQGDEALAHLSEIDREATFQEAPGALQLNTGVMWFRKTDRTRKLFALWRTEWLRFKDKDQGALLRALVRCPVSLFLLGRAFNGGAIIQHRFGACKRA